MPFARKRPIFDLYQFTLSRHKQSRKQSQIILERFWRRFREFGAISRTCQYRPCSKPWAIAQAVCSKSANFRPLPIHPKSTQTVAQAVRNHFRAVLESESLERFPGLAKTESGRFSTSTNSPIDTNKQYTNSRGSSHKSQILERFWRRFREFGAISRTCQNRPCSKPWAIAQAFCSKSADFQPYEFTLNRHKQSRKQSQIILERFWRRFREFGAISRTCQNRPWWAIAFCSKAADFRPYEFTLNRHKQSCKQSQIILEWFWRRFREFGAISRTCQNRPCSKPWAIAQGFCSKSANFQPVRIHPKSTQTVAQAVRNRFRSGFGGVSESLERFPGLAKIGHVQNHGL